MRALFSVLVLLVATGTGIAAPLKVVAFDIEPFELAPTRELNDLLVRESATLRRALGERGLASVDMAPKAAEIAARQPLGACNGCDLAIARGLGADVAVTTTVQELEYPAYNLFASVRDVATGHVLRKAVVSIDGLDAEDWDRGVTALAKERLLAQPLPADADALRDMVARLPVPPE